MDGDDEEEGGGGGGEVSESRKKVREEKELDNSNRGEQGTQTKHMTHIGWRQHPINRNGKVNNKMMPPMTQPIMRKVCVSSFGFDVGAGVARAKQQTLASQVFPHG